MNEGEGMFRDHDCAGDAAAYVLGALDPNEAEIFRRHLEECAVCRDEVEALGGVVQALPMAAPQQPMPRGVRRRVLRAVRQEAGLRADPPVRRTSAWFGSRAVLVATASVALLAAAVVLALTVPGGSRSGRVIQAQVAGISGTALLRVTGGHGELIVRHMSPPPPGHVYEVWLKRQNSNPVPASVLFSVGSNGSAQVGLPQNLRGVSQVMVTPEPNGGTPTPTHTPVIVASLA
jgi:anti-sigma-K factor RskA